MSNNLKDTLQLLASKIYDTKEHIKELDLVIITEIISDKELERILFKIDKLNTKLNKYQSLEKIIVNQYNALIDTVEVVNKITEV